MPNFITGESSEDSFTLTAANPTHLDTSNFLVLNTAAQVQAFTAAQFSGLQFYALNSNNAQLFINGQPFSGFLLNPASNQFGLNNVTLPAGQWWIGVTYHGAPLGSQGLSGFDEISTVAVAGESFIGNVPVSVGGNAGSWSAQGFNITGSPDIWVETEGSGGQFMFMNDAQFSAFEAAYPAGFHGGTFSYTYAFGGQSGGPATELEGRLQLPAGNWWLVWMNNGSTWAGGAADLRGFATFTGSSVATWGPAAAPGSASVAAAIQSTLDSAYSTVLRATLAGPDATLVSGLISQVASGALSLAAAESQINKLAENTSSVATMAYQFFTGGAPSAGGMDYLVNPTGPNPNNLNSAYFQSFNIENRYINFAVNLGKIGAGAGAFTAAYGNLDLFHATQQAYGVIFGIAPSDAKVHALLDPTVTLGGHTMTRADYFNAYGQDGLNGIGTKAAMVGWLLAEAVKADLGTYAKSNDAYLTDIALHGAPFGVDVIGHYNQASFAFNGG